MSRSTVGEAKAELYGLLWSAGAPTFSVSGIAPASIHVYDHEPAAEDLLGPIAIAISTAGMTPDDWVLSVRVYVTTAQYDAKKAQDYLDLLLPAVSARTAANGGYGPSTWEIGWDDTYAAFVAVQLLNVGREDLGDVGY